MDYKQYEILDKSPVQLDGEKLQRFLQLGDYVQYLEWSVKQNCLNSDQVVENAQVVVESYVEENDAFDPATFDQHLVAARKAKVVERYARSIEQQKIILDAYFAGEYSEN